MTDYMVRGISRDGQIRLFALSARDLVEQARLAHGTSPLVTAALGRAMCGALMMGDMLKNDGDLLTLQFQGDGPLGGLTVTADRKGRVKGYPRVRRLTLPHNKEDHLDVGGAMGRGSLTVIRDMGLKDPYVGTVPLQTGEIAEDLTYYYGTSEQIPSSFGLGVLLAGDESVLSAGGFLVQLLPFAEDAVIDRLEADVKRVRSVTDLLQDKSPEDLLRAILPDFELEIHDRMPVEFFCNCDRDRVARALILLGREELTSMIEDGEEVELCCQFCSKAYRFGISELKDLRKRAERA